uniref:G-protein coupled receptors family 1 profile domain-containing protein n=1 Tax=Moschus moschiferus TaxID=68415 RepID=A0A8C6FFU9_MOSMO
MKPGNHTFSVSEFVLLGLSEHQEQQPLLFGIFLSMYLITVVGNITISLAIVSDPHLHTPMYFFLAHFSLTDLGLSSTTVPRMLVNIQAHRHTITYAGCLSQIYFFLCFLLAVMAYDRYVAVCHPLHYTAIMRDELCVILVAGCWLAACAQALLHTLLLDQLTFCAGTVIPHFCDLAVVLKSSCSDTSLNELLILTEGGLIFTLPLGGILGSYIHMAAIILKVRSFARIFKALSTCGSHLFVVFLYYGTIAGVYYFPSSGNSKVKDIVASLMYMVVTPMLNPFIYSLRNKDVKHALQKFFRTMGNPSYC